MRTSRFSPKSIVRLTALAGTAALLVALHPAARDVWVSSNSDVATHIGTLRSSLPAAQDDGSSLRDATLDGTRLTLHLAVDERLNLATIRESGRDAKCAAWRDALRSRELSVVEYRYRQTGATSSLFLDRTVCG